MAKVEKPKPKAKPKPKFADKAQSERFIETARELGLDKKEHNDAFERAFSRLTRPRLPSPKD